MTARIAHKYFPSYLLHAFQKQQALLLTASFPEKTLPSPQFLPRYDIVLQILAQENIPAIIYPFSTTPMQQSLSSACSSHN
jgi:hypothetical protein